MATAKLDLIFTTGRRIIHSVYPQIFNPRVKFTNELYFLENTCIAAKSRRTNEGYYIEISSDCLDDSINKFNRVKLDASLLQKASSFTDGFLIYNSLLIPIAKADEFNSAYILTDFGKSLDWKTFDYHALYRFTKKNTNTELIWRCGDYFYVNHSENILTPMTAIILSYYVGNIVAKKTSNAVLMKMSNNGFCSLLYFLYYNMQVERIPDKDIMECTYDDLNKAGLIPWLPVIWFKGYKYRLMLDNLNKIITPLEV